jgi:hypothetical protein
MIKPFIDLARAVTYLRTQKQPLSMRTRAVVYRLQLREAAG